MAAATRLTTRGAAVPAEQARRLEEPGVMLGRLRQEASHSWAGEEGEVHGSWEVKHQAMHRGAKAAPRGTQEIASGRRTTRKRATHTRGLTLGGPGGRETRDTQCTVNSGANKMQNGYRSTASTPVPLSVQSQLTEWHEERRERHRHTDPSLGSRGDC